MIIMGKQLIDGMPMAGAGIAVVWLGIAIVTAVDGYVLLKVIRR